MALQRTTPIAILILGNATPFLSGLIAEGCAGDLMGGLKGEGLAAGASCARVAGFACTSGFDMGFASYASGLTGLSAKRRIS